MRPMDRAFFRAWPVLALVAACDGGSRAAVPPPYPLPEVAEGGAVVAKVGSVTLTSDEIQKRASGQGPVLLERFGDLERRKDFVEQQVRFELLAQEGWARGMYKDPEILGEYKKALVQKLLKEELDRRTRDVAVTEDELRAAYERAHDEFNKPETLRLSQILRQAPDAKARAEAHALLERVKREVMEAEKKNQTNAFAEAARAHSQDEGTKTAGGDLQFLTRPELEARFGPDGAKEAFEQAAVGELKIIDTQDAVILFKKTGLRRAIERPLEQVKAQIKVRVQRDKRNRAFDALIDELKKKHAVSVDERAVETLQLGGTPPPADAGNAP